MKRKTVLLAFTIVFIIFIGGCLPIRSLHPFYTEEDVIFDSQLLGKWESGKEIWEFRKMENKDKKKKDEKKKESYLLIISEKESPIGMIEGHLIKLGKYMFMDFAIDMDKMLYLYDDSSQVIEDIGKKILPLNLIHLIPAHTISRIVLKGDSLYMGFLDDEIINVTYKSMGKESKIIKYEEVEDNCILTAQTKELQDFVVKYADNEKAFKLDGLRRVKK
jgi:hypothetical protein